MKKLTFMFAMLLMAVVSFAQEVTLPEGLTTEEYEFTATKLASGFGLDEEVSRTVNVAFDGNDVYVQGLSNNETYASSWVKGVVNGDQITFEKEQELYVLDLGFMLIKGVFNPNSDVVFAYDAANNKMTADAYEISDDNGEGYHAIEQYANVVIAKAGGETPVDEPTVVTLPEGVTAVDYQMTATTLKNYNRVDVNRTVKVAVDGTDVYMQGLAECLPEAWVKGMLGGDEVVFEGSQLLGDNDGFDAMFEPDHEHIAFTYDAAADKYTISAYELQAKSDTWELYETVVIAKDNGGDVPGDDPIEPQGDFTISPEGVQQTSLSTFVITFNNYTVKSFMGEATATLTNTTTENTQTVDVEVSEDGKTATMNFEETTEPGKYTLQVVDLCTENYKFLDNELVFNYEIAGFEEPIEWTATPEAGEVEKIEVVTINFNKMLEVADGTQAYLFKGEEELQAKDITLTGGDKAVFVAFDEVTEAGEYQVVIPEGISTIAGEAVPEIAINYTIAGSVEPMEDYTISPEGTMQESLSTFVVTFNNFGVSTLGSEENATLKNNTTGVEQTAVMEISEDKKVVTMNFEETTEPGKYTLTLGDLWNASTYQILDPITANYEIAGAVEQLTWTATPEAGEVEKIEIVTVSFNKMVEVADGTQAYLFKGEEELQAKDITLTGGDKAVFVAFDEVTEAGEYQVVIPEGINTLEGEAVPEIAIDYTIVGEAPVLACEIDPAAGEVTSIKDFTLTFNGEVSLDAYDAQAVLTGGNLEEAVKAPLAISEDHKVVTFSFDEITEAGEYTLTIPEGAIFNRATFEDVAEMTFNYTIVGGEDDPTQPVVVPATATIEDWTLEGSLYASGGIQTLNQGTKVAFEGENIYIQGLCQYLPEAWVKGTFADGKAVLKSGQIYGTLEEGGETYEFYMMGANADSEGNLTLVDEFVLNYDADAEKFTLEDGVYILDNSNNTTPSFYDLFMSLVLTKGKYVAPEVVELPEGAVVEDWQYEAYDNYYQETVTRPSQVAFVGNEVYVNGITEVLPEAWIKGTLDGDKVTFAANQYLGHYESSYGSLDLFFNPEADVVFGYDAEAGKLTAAEYVTFTGSYNYDEMSDVVITKVPEAAAVPAIPTINEVEIATYSYMGATIPATSVDGEPLAASKLYYMILVEKAKDQSEPFVLKAENYTPYEEDMTEIPYMFNDAENYYIQAYGDVHYVYLLTDAEEIDTWYRLGVKSIYYGGGEVNESEIAWYTIKEYPTSVTGISEIAAEDEGSVYYDAMGRRTNSQAKGLLLKQVRMADGSVKTVKIARK